MAGSAFTFGVKPGGLTENTEVRILLCYLIKTVAPMAPLTRAEIEQALLGEQLVNYFELSAGLADLEENGLATVDEAGGWAITPKGLAMDKLFNDILILLISAVIMVGGGIMVTANAVGQVSAALQIPMQVYYAGVPVCGVLMILYSIPRIGGHIQELKDSRKEAK